MATTRRLRLNLLGVISLLIGVVACVAARVQLPTQGYGPVPIALLGLGVGVLAYLISTLFRRSGTGFPVLGILASVRALVLVAHDNGSLARWIAVIHPADETPKAPGSAAVKLSTPPVSTPKTLTPETSQEPDSPRPRSIFDAPGSGGSDSVGTYRPKPAPILPPVPIHPDPLPEPSASIDHTGPSIAEARAKLDAANAAVERSLANDPAYTQAKAAADAADARRKTALAESGSGSTEVLEAGKEWLDAKAKLQKIISTATANDAASQAAQRELTEAQATAHSAKPSGVK